MKWLALIFTLALALLLVSAVLAGANSVSMQETSLATSGEVYEVNLGSDGYLYVSDYLAKQIWRLNPETLAVTKYQFAINVSDARPDNAGNIWFTDGGPVFARLDPNTNQASYWEVPETHNLQGLAFDNYGKLWMTEWINFYSVIYQFDIGTTGLCTYTLPYDAFNPGSSQSFYILSRQDMLWIANRGEQRIYRLDSAQDQATWWEIGEAASRPVGLALDEQGNLWWADEGLGALMYLDTENDQLTRYNTPVTSTPKMLALHNEAVLYTAPNNGTAGYLGALYPHMASETPTPVNSHTYDASKQCNPSLGDGTPLFVSATTPTVSWTSAGLSLILENSTWKEYELPSGSSPYGLAIANDMVWITDRGRQKLMHMPLSVFEEYKLYLSVVLR